MANYKGSFWVKFVVLAILLHASNGKVNVHELKCEVCQRTVEEMEKDVDTVDPSKTIHVGEFMLDHKGRYINNVGDKSEIDFYKPVFS